MAHPLGLRELKGEGKLSTTREELSSAQLDRRKQSRRADRRRHHARPPLWTSSFLSTFYGTPSKRRGHAAAAEPWWEYLWNRYGPGEPKIQPRKRRLSPKRTSKAVWASPPKMAEQVVIPMPKPRPKAPKAISCEAAVGIVGDYGFSEVKTTSCLGEIYALTATRDGAAYTVQVSSADGEIAKVTKE
jgi:hypothetical protein